jgi:monoamine oxidase
VKLGAASSLAAVGASWLRPLRAAAQASGGPRQRVLILGAGVAGLSAAYELRQLGHEVIVLEAQLRPGGRVLTIRDPFADGLYGEAGAGRIPGHHDLTHRYIERFGLELEPFAPDDLDTIDFIRGHRVRHPARGEVALQSYGLKLTDEELRLGFSGMSEKTMRPLVSELGDVNAAGWPGAALKKYDDVSTNELRRRFGYSKDFIELSSLGWGNSSHHPGSALWNLRGMATGGGMGSGPLMRIKGGMDLLPKAFARELANEIHYGCEVVRIEQDAREVRLRYKRRGAFETASGDRLVVTLPFTVLRHLEVAPAFSLAKTAAIREMVYAPITRVLLQVRRGSWLEEGMSGYARTDLPCEIWQPSFNRPGPRALLVVYVKSDEAEHLVSMSDAARVDEIARHVAQVFPGIERFIENGVSKSWDADPWARGAYATFATGQVTRFLPHLATAEGRVHFAGDHTSPWFGWMQGSFHSGNRVAREIAGAQG